MHPHHWGASTCVAAMNDSADRRSAIETFIRVDRIGVVISMVFVGLVNALLIKVDVAYLLIPALGALWLVLSLALRRLDQGHVPSSLGLVAAGNWAIALLIAAMLPVLWPVMALTVLMPLVLATPFLNRRAIIVAIAAAAFTASLVGLIGLLADDGGIVPDLDDGIELTLVVGALAVQIVPIGLTVYQNNAMQTRALEQTMALNEDLDESRLELTRSRRRLVETADRERSRIERDLHDGAQQRLVALSVRLRLLQSQTADQASIEQLSGIIDDLDGAADELRELAHGIQPPILLARGLPAALGAIARRSAGNLDIEAGDIGRFDPSTESALYFAASEAITNANKHAPDSHVMVRLATIDDCCVLTVEDDGPGFDPKTASAAHGLMNIRDRIGALNGTVEIESGSTGSTVRASIPIVSEPSATDPGASEPRATEPR